MKISATQNLNTATKEAAFEAGEKFSLLVRTPLSGNSEFPTSRLAKGLILCCERHELVEEGLDVFPGSARLDVRKTAIETIVTVDYTLDLVKKLDRNGKTLTVPFVYHVEDWLGRLHREISPLRKPGGRLFGAIRNSFGLKSFFETVPQFGKARIVFTVPRDTMIIHVEADLSNINRDGLTEIIIANEQGAGHFDTYRDTDGLLLKGSVIGTWDEVKAGKATFIDSADDIAFTLPKIDGARLFRGLEEEAGRLSWAGLLYVLKPDTNFFRYDITLEKPS